MFEQFEKNLIAAMIIIILKLLEKYRSGENGKNRKHQTNSVK